MRLSTVILPIHRWAAEGRALWQRAEQLGLHAAYTYDHLAWRGSFTEGPWFGAVPTLAAAAEATSRIRLGTMVASPNFRHPVTLAKELMTLDDASGGRITAGIGAGGVGVDTALGRPELTARQRGDRFGEFVELLDVLLRQPVTTAEGEYYAAREARMVPGCVQRPRLPFTVAATGPRGLRLAARLGQGWVSTAYDPKSGERGSAVAARQLAGLREACAKEGRDPAEVSPVVLAGFAEEPLLDSVDAFVDVAGRYREAGFEELVVHWPVPDSQFAADPAVFEKAMTEAPRQLG